MPIPKVSPTGVTAIEAIDGAVTVRLVLDVTPARAAEMFVDPAATAFAMPPALIVATPVELELHATRFVRSALLPSV